MTTEISTIKKEMRKQANEAKKLGETPNTEWELLDITAEGWTVLFWSPLNSCNGSVALVSGADFKWLC